MKKSLLMITGLVLITFLSSVLVFAQSIEADKSAILESQKQYTIGVNTGNYDLWMSLWDENGIKMEPNHPAIIGKEAISQAVRELFKQPPPEMKIINEDLEIGGQWAFGRGNYTIKIPNLPMLIEGKYLTIYKKQGDGSWKIFRDCYNSNTPPSKK